MKLRPVFVSRWESPDIEWEWLRVLRNACAEGLTHYRGDISKDYQQHYRRTYSENVRHYLYWDKVVPVAFSRLEWRDGYVYPTYGVDPLHRGKGYAWEVVKHAMLAAGGPLRGDLLFNNEAIKKVDFALGWRPMGPPPDANGVLLVEADWPPTFIKEFV